MSKYAIAGIKWEIKDNEKEIHDEIMEQKNKAYADFLQLKAEEDEDLKKAGLPLDSDDREYTTFAEYFREDMVKDELIERNLGLPKKCVLDIDETTASDKDAVKEALKDKYGYEANDYTYIDKARSSEIARQNIIDSVQDIINKDDFKAYVQLTANFRNYSYNNKLLVYSSKPDATMVKTMQTWKRDYERNISKGSTQIWILTPHMKVFEKASDMDKMLSFIAEHNKKNKGGYFYISKSEKEKAIEDLQNGNKVEFLQYFGTMPVFDVSDTYGKELPMEQQTVVSKEEVEKVVKELCKEMKCRYLQDPFETFKNMTKQMLQGDIPMIPNVPQSKYINGMNDKLLEFERTAVSYMVCTLIGLDVPDSCIKNIAEAFNDNPYNTRSRVFMGLAERMDKATKYFLKNYDKIKTKIAQNEKTVNKEEPDDKENDGEEIEL